MYVVYRRIIFVFQVVGMLALALGIYILVDNNVADLEDVS